MKRSPIKRAGKKTRKWNAARAKLKERFLKAGITTCELRLENCTPTNFLSWAHRLKRRNITTQEELETVLLLCENCHWSIEKLGETKMSEIVENVIKNRRVTI